MKRFMSGLAFALAMVVLAVFAAFIGFLVAVELALSDWGYKTFQNVDVQVSGNKPKPQVTQEIALPEPIVEIPSEPVDESEDVSQEANSEVVTEVTSEPVSVPERQTPRNSRTSTSVKVIE